MFGVAKLILSRTPQQGQRSMHTTCSMITKLGSIPSSSFLFCSSLAGCFQSSFIRSMSSNSTLQFSPKRALVLGKLSRYDFEKRRFPKLSEEQLNQSVERRGSDYQTLLRHHKVHADRRDHIVKCLAKRNIETKVVNRFSYTETLIDWADIVITSGGDGTYLLAASRIQNSSKPLIGVNSDPARSVGHLCLPHKYSDDFGSALDKIFKGEFEWTFRQRIRITLESENAQEEPLELHNQQLMLPEYRFFELESLQKSATTRVVPKTSANPKRVRRLLPFRALNEVFIGESLSSRVSYFELAINEAGRKKIRSSGITICTGTGSTSWSFNINKLTTQCVHHLFKIINQECSNSLVLPEDDCEMVERVTKQFNESLIFEPSQALMAYTIRDPVVFDTNFTCNPRDFASKIVVKSRMTDAHVVIDGGLSYVFNDGAEATFEICEEDALRTIKLCN